MSDQKIYSNGVILKINEVKKRNGDTLYRVVLLDQDGKTLLRNDQAHYETIKARYDALLELLDDLSDA